MSSTSLQPDSPWPHRLAVALVATTFPLIWVGGLVTTYEAGMAVPDWPSTYGYNLFLYPWQTWFFGPWDLFIEHGHRLLGALAGVLTVALALSLVRCDTRAWMRWLGLVAIVAVVSQGVLGGMRVLMDERLLAKIHGCTGPLFFALVVALAAFTSRRWRELRVPSVTPTAGKLQRLALLTTFFAFAQIVLGAQLRHVSVGLDASGFRVAVLFHLFMAAVVTVHVVLLAARVLRGFSSEPWLARPAVGLLILIGFQLALGAGTWVVNYGWPAWFSAYGFAQDYVIKQESQVQALITTGHVAAGSLILVTSLLIALRSMRLLHSPSRRVELSTLALGVVA